MPYRKTPLVPGEIYHIFNRSIAKQPIFRTIRDYRRATEIIEYYRFGKLPLRFSHFNRMAFLQRNNYRELYMDNSKPMLIIHSYCIMPNHFHFLIQATQDKALSNFMRNFQNSYSKYFNTINDRTGSVFQAMFKAVRIETDEQLIHVSRYIHLNPITSYIINAEELDEYRWSSFPTYLHEGLDNAFAETGLILNFFPSRNAYKVFLLDQIDYQRRLDNIKHLILE